MIEVFPGFGSSTLTYGKESDSVSKPTSPAIFYVIALFISAKSTNI